MKTMGGKKRELPIEEQIIEFDVMVGDSVELQMEEEVEVPAPPPAKKHKKHKHKRHKKKRSTVEDEDEAVDVTSYSEHPRRSPKPSLKLKIKLAQESTPPRQKEKPAAVAGPSSPLVMNAATLKLLAAKKKKGGKGKESGTSSEEERWLDAIESGKLEEVDDELKKIKDPKLMTARQRAMFEKKTEKEPSPGGEQLMALPSGYKEKIVTEEILLKRAEKLQKRKQMAEEKREKDKKKTMERLLKKQESKTKGQRSARPSRFKAPQMLLRRGKEGETISLPLGIEFPLPKALAPPAPSPRVLCGVPGCRQPKRYACSKTGVPLCSLQCYKRNLDLAAA